MICNSGFKIGKRGITIDCYASIMYCCADNIILFAENLIDMQRLIFEPSKVGEQISLTIFTIQRHQKGLCIVLDNADGVVGICKKFDRLIRRMEDSRLAMSVRDTRLTGKTCPGRPRKRCRVK